jgi:hypothetical protein
MLAFRPVVATAHPHVKKSKDISRKLKQAIFHAKLICINLKDAKECSVAWDQVEELSAALNDVLTKEDEVWFDEKSTREYDV